MDTIPRLLEQRIDHLMFQKRVVLIWGARRVGKTTLVRRVLEKHSELRGRYLNCDLLPVQAGLSILDAEPLRAYLGDHDLVVLDEAQNVPHIGRVLKIIVDTYPQMQLIVTGSSALHLATQVGDPLTGRGFWLNLYPLSLQEIAQKNGTSMIEPRMDALLRFGAYPEMLDLPELTAQDYLTELISSYLYKDILSFLGVRKSSVVTRLLRLLALQLGGEVSLHELGTILGLDYRTVDRYIDILEQCFIVFRLGALSRNLRKEVARKQKIYFYDTGVRNAILQAFSPLDMRNDIGALWENFCIMERRKLLHYQGIRPNTYFWRTYDQKEIDYIEERDGRLAGFECKWSPTSLMKTPQEFLEAYPGSSVTRIDRSNYWRSLM